MMNWMMRDKKMKKILVLSFFFILSSCDSLDTSYDLKKAPPIQEAPEKSTTCTIDFRKTCWAETIRKVTSCLGEDREGLFSFDKKFCTNNQQMLIDFADPTAMFHRPYDVFRSPIDFRILSDSKNECFRIQGTRTSFEISLKSSGEKVYFEDDGKSLRFTCLDGQEVFIDSKNFEGCNAKQGEAFQQTIPGLELTTISEQSKVVGWQLSIRGADQDPVFRCRE
jgi:hypothetical protein